MMSQGKPLHIPAAHVPFSVEGMREEFFDGERLKVPDLHGSPQQRGEDAAYHLAQQNAMANVHFASLLKESRERERDISRVALNAVQRAEEAEKVAQDALRAVTALRKRGRGGGSTAAAGAGDCSCEEVRGRVDALWHTKDELTDAYHAMKEFLYAVDADDQDITERLSGLEATVHSLMGNASRFVPRKAPTRRSLADWHDVPYYHHDELNSVGRHVAGYVVNASRKARKGTGVLRPGSAAAAAIAAVRGELATL